MAGTGVFLPHNITILSVVGDAVKYIRDFAVASFHCPTSAISFFVYVSFRTFRDNVHANAYIYVTLFS